MKQQDKTHGEGNYKATRDYNEATKRFLDTENVDEAARRAAPKDAQEEKQLRDAERIARSRAKGEDADPDLWNEDASIDDDVEDLSEQDNLRRSHRD